MARGRSGIDGDSAAQGRAATGALRLSARRQAALNAAPLTIFDVELHEMEQLLETLRPRSASAALALLQSCFPNSALSARSKACEAYARTLR